MLVSSACMKENPVLDLKCLPGLEIPQAPALGSVNPGADCELGFLGSQMGSSVPGVCSGGPVDKEGIIVVALLLFQFIQSQR